MHLLRCMCLINRFSNTRYNVLLSIPSLMFHCTLRKNIPSTHFKKCAFGGGLTKNVASVGADGSDAIFLYESVICGHHVYKRVWTPITAEILSVITDLANRHNHFAVAVLKAGAIVGHVPKEVSRVFYEVSRVFYFFLLHGGRINADWFPKLIFPLPYNLFICPSICLKCNKDTAIILNLLLKRLLLINT